MYYDKVIPIIVMTRNEAEYIENCIYSLLDTRLTVQLIVVDNASTDQKHIDKLKRLSEIEDVHVILCDSNRWVINLDYAFELIKKRGLDFDYFALTDGDTEVSKSQGDWLDTLVGQMSDNRWLGKLGTSINLTNIEGLEAMSEIYIAEKRYFNKMIAPEIYLAPVDTTLALYRKDVFVYKTLKLRPGHMSAIRPYYHVGRSAKVNIVHRGWESYSTNGVGLEKVRAFSKLGAHIQWQHFRGSGFQKRYYQLIAFLYRAYWGLDLCLDYFRFVINCKLVRQNKIYEQSKLRHAK